MNIELSLKEATDRRQKAVDEFNALETKKQELIQEMLRLDGEVRALKRLIEDVPAKDT